MQRDGFEVLSQKYLVKSDVLGLDRLIKRRVTICNLFINYEMPIGEIARLLDETRAKVVAALIEEELIKERRSRSRDGSQSAGSDPLKVASQEHRVRGASSVSLRQRLASGGIT